MLLALVVFFVVIIFFLVLRQALSSTRSEQIQLQTRVDLGIARSQLENVLNENLFLVNGLEAYLAVSSNKDLTNPAVQNDIRVYSERLGLFSKAVLAITVVGVDAFTQQRISSFGFDFSNNTGLWRSVLKIPELEQQAAKIKGLSVVVRSENQDLLFVAKPIICEQLYCGMVFATLALKQMVAAAKLQFDHANYTTVLSVPGASENTFGKIPQSETPILDTQVQVANQTWQLFAIPKNAWQNPFIPWFAAVPAVLFLAFAFSSLVFLFSQERFKNQYVALYDPLTGLGNRRLFEQHLQSEIKRTANGGSGSVLVFSIDNFRAINEKYGFTTGDHVLLEVATRIQSVLGHKDIAARFRADEFVILCPDTPRNQKISVAGWIQRQMAEPLLIQTRAIHLITSIGVSVYPDQGVELNVLIENADNSWDRSTVM